MSAFITWTKTKTTLDCDRFWRNEQKGRAAAADVEVQDRVWR